MNDTVSPPSALKPLPRLASTLGWLTAALLAVFPLFAWVGQQRHGAWGLITAAVAGGICWLAGAVALTCVRLTRDTAPLAGLLGSIFFRMGLPLVAGVVLQSTHAQLAAAGIFGNILLYYLITLVVETTLSVRLIQGPTPVSRAS